MEKVLVVDDTKNIRTLLTKCLQIEGYEVKTANNGTEALDIFSQESFALAFIDIKMPHLSGTEVLKHIREKGIKTPVIIITAYATVKNAIECTQMGAVAYLQKPFTADKVRNTLRELQGLKLAEETNYHLIAEKMLQENHFHEAFNFLKKAIAEKSLDADIYLLLAKACTGLGYADEAERYMKIYECIK